MPKWSKDAKEFAVNVHYNDENKGTQIRIPKPILEKMNNPERVKFVIDGKSIKFMPEVEQARESLRLKKKRNQND